MEYLKKCEQCDKEYSSERSTSRFCSDSCRVTANRLSITDPLSVTTKSVTAEKSDYTRKMVEDRLADFKKNGYAGDDFIPNWYKLGFSSKNHCLQGIH